MKKLSVTGEQMNASAVVLLAIVMFFYGESMRQLPENVNTLLRVQALLVYRVEQLETTVNNQRSVSWQNQQGEPQADVSKKAVRLPSEPEKRALAKQHVSAVNSAGTDG